MSQPPHYAFSKDNIALVDNVLADYIQSQRLAGAALLIAQHGEVLHEKQFGFSHLETRTPMQADNIFRIYSMTKPITAMAMMILLERGLFELHDPVSRFIPEFENLLVLEAHDKGIYSTRPAKRDIHIHDLLTHRAGLTYDFMENCKVAEGYREQGISSIHNPFNLQTFIEKLTQHPLVYDPGLHWMYSMACEVQGYLIEKISGQSLRDFLMTEIFKPLKMPDTDFFVPEDKRSRFTACYTHNSVSTAPGGKRFLGHLQAALAADPNATLVLVDDATHSPFNQHPVFYSGGGGLVSTMHDYYRFMQCLAGDKQVPALIQEETRALMTSNQINTDLATQALPGFTEIASPGFGFGFGMAVAITPDIADKPCNIGEVSWGGAASTAFFIDPSESLICIVLTQLFPSSIYNLRDDIRHALYGIC